ncbi:uncharacterized protein LOC121244206 [Juglans microcarpa x Juglans regia]|uniref:uncharacterized protein LOC121244206 n=1 Tax=Juglans microcarpa x Juglans regia TaxID=2249226 RepID=UPI001B7F7843|nr:uncharacterized protein LOC121244206 [Juglans microcarpa x Juglans regia]
MSGFAEDRNNKKRVRDDLEESSELDSPEVKRLRENLLGFFDDSDPDPTFQDLASVMKSFEEEISRSQVPVVDLTSDSGESQPELGYLLEASDDELGLPPSGSSSGEEGALDLESDLVRVTSESPCIGGLWGFEDQIPSYDSFELVAGERYNDTTEYVAFDGLFEYSDMYFDSSDFSDLSWRHGTLPAQ